MNANLYDINNRLLQEFGLVLKKSGASDLTVKNYLSDVRAFLRWRSTNFDNFIDEEEFLKVLKKKFRPSSVKRKASAVKKFLQFERTFEMPRESSPRYSFNTFNANYLLPAFSVVSLLLLVSAVSTTSRINAKLEDSVAIPSDTIISNQAAKRLPLETMQKAKGVSIALSEDNALSEYFRSEAELPYITYVADKPSADTGTGTIFSGEREAVIASNLITPETAIFLTATSSTGNQILYIKKQGPGLAVVAIDSPASQDITFNWQVNNTEIYHSIY